MDEPFEILLHLVQERKLDPWEVDIGRVMDVLSKRVFEEGVDLRLSGRAALSASTILRIKSERMNNGNGHVGGLEDIQEPPEFDIPDIGPLVLIQHEGKKITLAEFLGALREALREIPTHEVSRRRKIERIVKRLDEFRVRIEERMEELYSKILALSGGGEVKFSDLLEERNRMCAVRTLLLLLFLSAGGKVELVQDRPFGEIRVLPVRERDGDGKR